MSGFDAAVFDFDGVIVDSRAPVRTAVAATLRAHGFGPRPAAELDRFIGPPVLAAFAELTGRPEGSAIVAMCAETYHREYERVYLEQTVLVDEIESVLEAIHMPLALATAKQVEFTLPLLDHLRLGARFAVVCAARHRELGEPKRAIVERAIRGLGAERAVVIGDTAFDIDAAHENGVSVIGVTWGIGHRLELERAGADEIVDRPDDLLALLSVGCESY